MKVRLAVVEDIPAINALTQRSIRALHEGHYPPATIESAIRHAYGVDWQLVRDGSYFVAELDRGLAGAGGWSWRKTIAGAHGPNDPPGDPLDPSVDAARIRAFYVDPDLAGRGVGTALLKASEREACNASFARAALTSTLPARPFYARHGYALIEPFELPLPDGSSLTLMLMEKRLRN
ncbi:GNAT family N-acetyltransferase [Sphingosinicella sp. BN140058]|uniref:GNAT family N-acetyltransferase n=1 Tax=Sphingosinicella sp. BN140058 TaxID=1892855 RepID=UPI0010104C98|nr:GNAT family N-acetyltransferase [Sphingosinicella sp. BN140058]QAY77544.1 N-acetyltransferase [Sphingosinicella sp. BN140058]